MTRYNIHFLDHVGNVTHHIDRDNDEAAIAAVQDVNILPGLGRFELWAGDRLVHRHPGPRNTANPISSSSSQDRTNAARMGLGEDESRSNARSEATQAQNIAGGPAESFRTPRGTVAITIKVQDESPTTVLFGADTVADIVGIVEQTAGRPPYHDFVRELAARFVSCKKAGADLTVVGAGVRTAFSHPQVGAAMREAVSRELCEKGKAHISWRLTKKGLGLALADKFINLDPALSEPPRDHVLVVDHMPDDEFKPN